MDPKHPGERHHHESAVTVFTALGREARAIGPAARVIGMRASRMSADDALSPVVIVAGLGGGLDPTLRTGDVVVDDPGGIVPTMPGITRGRIFTSDVVIATPADKRALFERTGAVCVDMEQDVVRAWARGATVVGIRAICDTADESLDPELLGCIDAVGTPRIGRVAMLLLRRPGTPGQMLRLRRASGTALRSLGAAVRAIAARIEA